MKFDKNSSFMKMGIFTKIRNVSNQTKNFGKLIMFSIFFNHVMASLWFLQAKLSFFPTNSWVYKENLVDAQPHWQYAKSFYWAL